MKELALEKKSRGVKGRVEEELEPEEVMRIIEKEMGRVELLDCVAMGDLRRWEEVGNGQEEFFRDLASVACLDALGLIPVG